MATLNSRLESLEREGSEVSVFGEMSPQTRARLDQLRDPLSVLVDCASPAPTSNVTLPPHTRRFIEEMRANWIAQKEVEVLPNLAASGS